MMEGLRYCPNCSGSGKDWKEKVQIPCSYCGGTGRVEKRDGQ